MKKFLLLSIATLAFAGITLASPADHGKKKKKCSKQKSGCMKTGESCKKDKSKTVKL